MYVHVVVYTITWKYGLNAVTFVVQGMFGNRHSVYVSLPDVLFRLVISVFGIL